MPGTLKTVCALALVASATATKLALTPPMGWMSWEMFRCDIDCDKEPTHCINANLYETMTDALVHNGFFAAGYDGIHIDDCWETKNPPRNPITHELLPDESRFPEGFKALGDYMHAKNVKFAIYTAESTHTCGGYPASAGFEEVDAKTFASWGVDYLKVDGCGPAEYYEKGYAAMGQALQACGRDIVYSCSWPAYLGSNESTKPYPTMIADYCNLWRNYADIQCSWSSLAGIIEHYGEYSEVLKQYAGPDGPGGGHWNDMDMLLIGNDCITDDEGRTQLAIWSIMAAPLIMGNDVRNISANATATLTNAEAIAVNQDTLGSAGVRVTAGDTQLWYRNLSNGDVAVVLYNLNGGAAPTNKTCGFKWDVMHDGYYAGCTGAAGNERCFEASSTTLEQAQAQCCGDSECAGFSWPKDNQSEACFKKNAGCGETTSSAYDGYFKHGFTPSPDNGVPVDITFSLADVGITGGVAVRDIYAKTDLGTATGSFTAKQVPHHGVAFLRLSKN